jgi:hypothetical protein
MSTMMPATCADSVSLVMMRHASLAFASTFRIFFATLLSLSGAQYSAANNLTAVKYVEDECPMLAEAYRAPSVTLALGAGGCA